MKAALLDTSVLVAGETGRTIDRSRLPDEAYVSVISLAELHAGVLAAVDAATRSARLATLTDVAKVSALPVDGEVARIWAMLRIEVRDAGRRVNVNDLWIAATAKAHGLPVVTQDGDFAVLAELGLLDVVQV